MARILLTGAAGTIGRSIAPLLAADHHLVLLDRALPPDASMWEGRWVQATITDQDALAGAMRDVDLVVHLAGISTEAPWQDLLAANVDGTKTLLETARGCGVRRILLASSIHAAGYLPGEAAGVDAVRPDSFYGVTKVAIEALGALYAERYAMSIVSARICTFGETPSPGRTLATWLSPRDMARLVTAVAALDDAGHRLVWAVSNNAAGWFDLGAGYEIGFHPVDDADAWFGQRGEGHEAPAPSQALGGSFLDLPLGG
ncbi:NAD-dependent epimerase/dehydratase family protein [Microbacterium sp. NPDC055903]